MGTGEFNAGGNHAMDYYPIRGGVDIHGTETGISSSLMSHLAHMQTLPFTHPSLRGEDLVACRDHVYCR